MDCLLSSLRYTLRLLLKSPGFTITAVLILGFGIGVNTAIFSLIDNVLLKPLPFPDQDRLVQITQPYQHDLGTNIDYPDYIDIVRNQHTCDAIAVAGWDGIDLTGGIGLLSGLAVGLVAAHLIQRLLYGVSPIDPISFGVSLLFLGITAVLACLLPGLRAIRINPITALRE